MRKFYNPSISGNDLRRIRRATGFRQKEAAEIAGCTVFWLCQLEHRDRVGNAAFIPKVEAWINAMRQRETGAALDAKAQVIAPEKIERQARFLEDAGREQANAARLQEHLESLKSRRDLLQTDDGFMRLFLECWTIPGDPNGTVATPIETFVLAAMRFCEDEELSRKPDKLATLVENYLRQNYHVSPAGVFGLHVQWRGSGPSPQLRYRPQDRPHEHQFRSGPWDEVVLDSIEVERRRATQRRPGLRHRWGEPRPTIDPLDYVRNGLPIPPIGTRRR